jgi:L-ribulose-5-phosphate 3-epimerase
MMARKRKIGIIVDSLKMGTREGIAKVKELGADGFQIYCTKGDMAPENMSKDDREDFKKYVSGLGLEVSALCGDLGKGFLDAESNKETLPRCKAFVDLAVDLDVRIVTSHIGRLPADEKDPVWAVGIEALTDLGAYAESKGCVFAMETGPEPPQVLKAFLDKIDNKGVGANYDPANFILWGPYDHIGGVGILKDYIVHTHAKDGVCLLWSDDPYEKQKLEVPLGDGSVAFKYYLQALDEIGYDGYLTIEREVGDDPAADIAKAVRFLKEVEIPPKKVKK